MVIFERLPLQNKTKIQLQMYKRASDLQKTAGAKVATENLIKQWIKIPDKRRSPTKQVYHLQIL